MRLEILPVIEPKNALLVLSNKRGIYFWFTNDTCTLVYIGVALGAGGLKKRVISQHLNPAYLEYRPHKQTKMDKFQLEYAICRIGKDGKTLRHGIDKSAFRKAIARKLILKPGAETVQYIIDNLHLKIFESENISAIKELEVSLIKKHKPIFNTTHNSG